MSYYVYIVKQGEHFVGDVPALPGCSTLGRSEEEVIENIRYVVKGYFQKMRKTNRPVPKVKVIRLSEEVQRSLEPA